jgi:hypothetical protein
VDPGTDILPTQLWREPEWTFARERLGRATSEQLAVIARSAALLAVERAFDASDLSDVELATDIADLKSGDRNAGRGRGAEAAARRFDADAFDIRDEREQQGDSSGRDDYREAFARARAASAVQAALSDNPQEAARTALYEARHAIADDRALTSLLNDELAAK